MPRGRKKQENVSLEERLADVTAQIERTEDTLKDLRRQRKEIEKLLEEQKKEQLYKAVVDSGKTIEEILEVLGRMDTDTKE
jgi:predicted  nucleic acid-binding Zn-ribbon protein